MKVIGIKSALALQQTLPARSETVKGLLHEGGTSVWLAAPKQGKSTIMRQLAVDVAVGRPFLGRETKQGKVLLVGLEDDLRSVLQHLDHLDAVEGDGSLFLTTKLDGHGSPANELESTLKQIGQVSLVIIDTLQRFARLTDPNDYGEVVPFMAQIGDLAKTSGAHIALVHHSRKRQGTSATESALGSTAIVGGVDVPIVVTREPNGLRAISSEGGRYTRPLEKIFLRYDPETGRTTLADSQNEIREKVKLAEIEGAKETIRAFISVNPDAEQQEVLSSLKGLGGTQRHELLQELFESGELSRSGSGRKGDPYRFSLKAEEMPGLLQ